MENKVKLTKEHLEPIEKVVNTLSENYPDTSFSFEVRNYGKERLPDFAIYASDGWVKPCGSCHCSCGNTKQGGRERFLDEINEMLSNEVKTTEAKNKKKERLIQKKEKEIELLQEEIERLTPTN